MGLQRRALATSPVFSSVPVGQTPMPRPTALGVKSAEGHPAGASSWLSARCGSGSSSGTPPGGVGRTDVLPWIGCAISGDQSGAVENDSRKQ